jgi:hypothetical protein
MKPKSQKNSATVGGDFASIRTTVTFDTVVWEIIQRQMKRRGFNNNLSSYLADVSRRDEERTLELEALRKVAGGGGKKDAEVSDNAVSLAAREIIRRASKKASGHGHSHGAASGLELVARAGVSPAREILGFRPAQAAAPRSGSRSLSNLPATRPVPHPDSVSSSS